MDSPGTFFEPVWAYQLLLEFQGNNPQDRPFSFGGALAKFSFEGVKT